MHFLLIYDVVDDYVNRRAPFREQHLALANEFAARGELLLGGALSDPVDGAVLVFSSAEAAAKFAARDSYIAQGLVPSWKVRQWNTVAGSLLHS